MAVYRVLGRAAVLLGTLFAVALLALPAARAATGAHSASAARASHSRVAAPAAHAETVATTAPDGGVCGVAVIGDIGSAFGFCQAGSSGLIGDLNNICSPGTETPEPANSGLNTLIEPPGGTANGKTLYDSYGIAGQFWAAYGLQCSDMTSLIGNNVAGMVFDMAKALDRVTITVYQSAAGNGILAWLQGAVDKVITALGNAVYFPYLAPVVILGAIWLAWQGLIRKRATRTIEGTLWMVIAAAAAIWLIGRPADFTGVGTSVSNGVTQALNVAFAKLPATNEGNCVPVGKGDPQSVTSSYAFTSANGLVDQNANDLWSVLVCKPWLAGELGTTAYTTSANGQQTPVNAYGRALLWSQAIATDEQPTNAVIQAKQATYVGIAQSMQSKYPATYALFQGKQWTTRLEIGFAALFAAVAAGLLILLIALTLIVLKLGFLLLLVMGPFFLIIGTHPGFGRVVAIRWFEMLAGVLMKQVAIALALSVLLYCYSLIMGTSDTALPWALKILMIALVTVAVFIYRKPFQHLFSAVGYGMIGSTERAEYSFREAGEGFRRSSLTAASVGIPGVAAYRAARWARRNPAAAATLAAAGAGIAAGAGVAAGAAAGAEAAAAAGAGEAGMAGAEGGAAYDAAGTRLRPETLPGEGDGGDAAGAGSDGGSGAAGLRGGSRRNKNWPTAGSGGGRAAPPLPLPPTDGSGAQGGSSAGWARGSGARAGAGAGTGRATAAPPTRSNGSAAASGGGPAAGTGSVSKPAVPQRVTSSSAPPPRQAAAPPAQPSMQRSSGSGSRSAWPGGPGWFGAGGPSAGAGGGPGNGGSSGGSGRHTAPRGRATGGGSAGSGRATGSAPAGNGSAAAPGNGAASPGGKPGGAEPKSPLPFWLRPVRRDK